MIRAIRIAPMAQDDAGLITGWNLTPNEEYAVALLPGDSACGVLVYDEVGGTLLASGAALVGTDQPCVLTAHGSTDIGMLDADLGWHLLLTTTGTEAQRTVRIGPAVDLPDEVHPVYQDDDLALARATAAINDAAHYVDEVTVSCPTGLGAWLGDVVSVPVDGEEVVGQVESITFTGTPDGAMETAVIRRHVAIAPPAFEEPPSVPTGPTVANDTAALDNESIGSGNVLNNDEADLTVTAVNGLASQVGASVAGSNGGTFVIASTGSWSFDPGTDFDDLEGEATRTTSVSYHASDGTAESMATLTVTVSDYVDEEPPPVDGMCCNDLWIITDYNSEGNVYRFSGLSGASEDVEIQSVGGLPYNSSAWLDGSAGGRFKCGNMSFYFDPDGDFDGMASETMQESTIQAVIVDNTSGETAEFTVTAQVYKTSRTLSLDSPYANEQMCSPSGTVSWNLFSAATYSGGTPVVTHAMAYSLCQEVVPIEAAPLQMPGMDDALKAAAGEYTVMASGDITFDPNGDFDHLGTGDMGFCGLRVRVCNGVLCQWWDVWAILEG